MLRSLAPLALLALAGCVQPSAPCLTQGERARITGIATNPPGGATVKLTTDNQTMRVCRGPAWQVATLNDGEVIEGFDLETHDWWRVR